ncbi:MAG: hypothetical protein LBK99_05695 [Opitutaceae bacterium]|nr:hypothetical protein [Opitutaceae bacterium]
MTHELDVVIPALRRNMQAREGFSRQARKLVPGLFDAKSREGIAAKAILTEMPELRRFPDYNLRLAQMVIGQRTLELARKRAASGGGSGGGKRESRRDSTKKPRKLAPRVPHGGGSGKGGEYERGNRKGAGSQKALERYISDPSIETLSDVTAEFLE